MYSYFPLNSVKYAVILYIKAGKQNMLGSLATPQSVVRMCSINVSSFYFGRYRKSRLLNRSADSTFSWVTMA